MKKFYLEALAAPSGEGWAVLLDGKQVKTPAKNPLVVADKKLAGEIAAEWRAQKDSIDPETMPLTRLASITSDRAGSDRDAWVDAIARYAETDLVCYHAPDEKLGRLQHAAFDPLLKWAATLGLEFTTTDSLMPVAQPDITLTNTRTLIASATDGELAALAMMVPLLGSLVIAIALWKGRITLEQALAAARLDEDFHAQKWGVDEEAARAWELKQKDITAAAFFLTCNHQK